MFRLVLKRVVYPILQPFSKWYFSKPRSYRYKDLKVLVKPGVFFPHLTISTKVLLEYLDQQNLKDQSVLELGAGCGIVSFRCAQKNAIVTASDISSLAIDNLKANQQTLGLEVKIQKSDLFDSLAEKFDMVIINPPYYPKDPKSDAEKAWFCGSEFQYFENLARQLGDHLTEKGFALMILSEDCEIDRIQQILKNGRLEMNEVSMVKRFGERNFLYRIT
ncbi:MAG: release factor glutamine methyltransferase [Bacteroidia bacterium]|jgi:release factor glutamine methyltransferase